MSEDRLTELDNGKIRLELKTPWRDGTRAIALTPHELLEKLVVLVPKPGDNQLVYHGVLAPNSKYRAGVTRYGRKEQPEDTAESPSPKQLTLKLTGDPESSTSVEQHKASRPSKWAELMQRAFEIDVLACECGGRLRFIDCYCEARKIEQILWSLGLIELESRPSRERAPPKRRDDGPLFALGK